MKTLKLKILLVEDDLLYQELLVKKITEEEPFQLEIMATNDPFEAEILLDTLKNIDVVIIDPICMKGATDFLFKMRMVNVPLIIFSTDDCQKYAYGKSPYICFCIRKEKDGLENLLNLINTLFNRKYYL